MAGLYLISGNDDFAIKAQSRAVIVALCGEDAESDPALEIIQGDRDEAKPEDMLTELLSALRTPPFLTPDKKVWLRHFAYFEQVLATGAGDLNKKRLAELTEFIKKGIPEDITLIMDGPDVDQRKAFFKICKAAPAAEVIIYKKTGFGEPQFAENQRQLIQQIADRDGRLIDPAAVYYLSETVSGDRGQLQNELEKIFCYAGDNRRVTLNDCKAVGSCTPEAMGWEFANALADRNRPAALRLVSALTKQLAAERGGNIELSLLSQAMRVFQEMVKTKRALAELKAPAQIGKAYFSGIPASIKERFPDNMLLRIHPFRAYKICESAARFTDRQLARILRAILDADRRLVSGSGEPRIVLEQLAISITGG
ncbi:MAG: DNA polymerase III subunit delta [Victivallaceae bacterium]|nr:DNA polymerase III subunit delta [Victivallaceae bacterium]